MYAVQLDERQTRGRNYATSYVHKMAFLQYFHLFNERDSCLICHLMEKEMVVLCGKILCIWIICVSSHPFSQLPPVCLFTHSSLCSSQPLCARFEMLFCSMCAFFATAAAADCSLCSFLSVFIGLLDCFQLNTKKSEQQKQKYPIENSK